MGSEDSSEVGFFSGDMALSAGDGGTGETTGGKVMVRAAQSIDGLKADSQLRPKTAVDGESSLVT